MQQIFSILRIVQVGIEIVSGLQLNCYVYKFILIKKTDKPSYDVDCCS